MERAAAGMLQPVDLQGITAPCRQLDLEAEQAKLDRTVARSMPRKLVLDPFVRRRRNDENVSGEVDVAGEDDAVGAAMEVREQSADRSKDYPGFGEGVDVIEAHEAI